MGRSTSLTGIDEDDLAWESATGAVVLRDVTKRYGDLRAVDHLSLAVRPAEFLSILGPSGSGKTTTMRLIGGFIDPDEGSIRSPAGTSGTYPRMGATSTRYFRTMRCFRT